VWISVKDDVECVGRDILPYFILILDTTIQDIYSL